MVKYNTNKRAVGSLLLVGAQVLIKDVVQPPAALTSVQDDVMYWIYSARTL